MYGCNSKEKSGTAVKEGFFRGKKAVGRGLELDKTKIGFRRGKRKQYRDLRKVLAMVGWEREEFWAYGNWKGLFGL